MCAWCTVLSLSYGWVNSTKYCMPYVMQYFGTRDELRVAQPLALNALGFAGLYHNFNLALNVVFGVNLIWLLCM